MKKVEVKLNKIVAIQMIFVLTLYYFIFVGMTAISYALDVVKTNHENVEFTAYFMDDNGEKVEKIEDNIDKENKYLYVEVSVKNEGYFNGTINLSDNNFNIKPEVLSESISSISQNTVTLKQINAGSTALIKLAIEPIKTSTINSEMLDKKTKVNLDGQYVNSKNVEKDGYINITGSSEVELKLKSSENTNVEFDAKVLTNSVYEINGENKRLVQLLINSKITNNNYPVKNTKIKLNIPENVEETKVHTRSTKATNSKIEFGENNYKINKEEGTLEITLSNEDTENISWEQDGNDLIVVTYVLDSKQDLANQKITITDNITTYDDKELNAEKELDINETIDGIVSTEIENSEEALYKGKLYTGEEREYKKITKVNVDYLNIVDNLKIQEEETKFLENETEKTANVFYRETKIEKSEFLEIFGEEGFITIKKQDGTVLANINKDTVADYIVCR